MRLDKFISNCTGLTRSQATKVIRQGRVEVHGEPCKQAATQLKEDAVVTLDDERLTLTGPRYLVLHKPAGYVCSSDDPEHPTVMMLLDEPALDKLNPV
ncbi:MAG: 16S rRNA pseudouridine(516) synthase, partial [Alkalimonas sp.]|nr:16S rRNA pseudouridine(516) synthase [Alkalimonas sp.]